MASARTRSGATASSATDPLVSVLIPTHNRRDLLLSRALPSVLGQTYQNLEVIVACHGCTDGTVEAVEGLFLDGEIRLDWLEVPRRRTYPPTAENHWLAGPVAPLNAALKIASGDWLARIDDDDRWTPDHLEKALRCAVEGDFEFVSATYARHPHPGVIEFVRDDGGTPPIGGTQTWLWRSYLKFMRWNPDCWRKDRDRVNDTDLAQRMRAAGVRIGKSPHVGAVIVPRPGETAIGSRAYLADAAGTERRYAFE